MAAWSSSSSSLMRVLNYKTRPRRTRSLSACTRVCTRVSMQMSGNVIFNGRGGRSAGIGGNEPQSVGKRGSELTLSLYPHLSQIVSAHPILRAITPSITAVIVDIGRGDLAAARFVVLGKAITVLFCRSNAANRSAGFRETR